MTDKDLVHGVLSGSQGALTQLIKQHQRLVAHIVFRLIDNAQDREELSQDIFMKVFDNLAEFKFDAKLSTWIATIAYRMTVNKLRKTKRHAPEEDLDNISYEIGAVDDAMEKKDFAVFIHHLIDQLPTNYRTVLTLYHLEGFSYPEIVDITGLPEGTVKNYLFRARNKLKELSLPYIGTEITI